MKSSSRILCLDRVSPKLRFYREKTESLVVSLLINFHVHFFVFFYLGISPVIVTRGQLKSGPK